MKNLKVFEDFDIPYEGWTSTYSSQNEGHDEELKNYMFFQHLMTIKDAVDDLLKMDRAKIDEILSDGHGWAVDHVTTSVDDVEEVYHFLKNRMAEHFEDEPAMGMPTIQILGDDDKVEVEEDDENEDE
jgi:hypothetical protein